MPNFLTPTPARGRTHALPENFRTQKFGFGFLFQGRIKHAPNCGYLFCVAFAPLFPEWEFSLFKYRKTPCFSGKSFYCYRISIMNCLFPLPGNRGQNVTRDGGPQSGACLIGVEIWEGDERRRIQFIQSRASLTDQILFTELPFLHISLPKPSFTECLAFIQ